MDVEKQVQYWREGAVDDLESVDLLLRGEKIDQALFFAHLALEKALKSLVCRATKDVPPLIHNLERLAELSRIDYSEEQEDLFREANRFCIKGRYELPYRPVLPLDEATKMVKSIKETVRWLTER